MFALFLCFLLCSVFCSAADLAEPPLTYSTYLLDNAQFGAIATDSSGNVYLAGSLVVKLNAQTNQYVYMRDLGGSAIAVDAAGNAYIAGSTASPDFPVTNGGAFASAPGPNATRSFIVKLDPDGEVIFSDILGGAAVSAASAVAVDGAGHVFVSGTSSSAGFPSTSGAYNVPDTTNRPYLLELDPTGTQIVFSATGIGGSALALDSSGNIYVAGSTALLDYPTTPGAYQTVFPAFLTCYAPCNFETQGLNQYVTKVDPSGSKLIFSTAVSGGNGTTNAGLAVDGAGNVYLTGFAGAAYSVDAAGNVSLQGTYPFTVTPPALPSPLPPIVPNDWLVLGLPFLSKLDSSGQNLLWSVPVGGAGVQVGGNGIVYVGGNAGPIDNYYVAASDIPALANVPPQCLPPPMIQEAELACYSFTPPGAPISQCLPTPTIQEPAYASKVDTASGDVRASEFIGGSELQISGIALYGSTIWLAGSTNRPDFPFSPNALTAPSISSPGGAYLGAVDFGELPRAQHPSPQIGCVLNSANFAPAGIVAPYEELTILGAGLGPATGVNAPDYSTTSLAGVTVTFDGVSAPLLYVSSTQITLAVPAISFTPDTPVVRVTVDGAPSSPFALLLTSIDPSVVLNLPESVASGGLGFFANALNADGSVNSASNPARLGSVISVSVNGLSPNPEVVSLTSSSSSGWPVVSEAPQTPFLLRLGLQVPSQLGVNGENIECPGSNVCTAQFGVTAYPASSVSPQGENIGAVSFGGTVYVTGSQ
jgi:uncharacterized protein (TIGR03437 family)